MAVDGDDGVRRAHATAIIAHTNQLLSAKVDGDGDACGTGIERVLDEFLHDGGGALHDLAGRDLVGEIGREAMDAIHSQFFLRKAASIATTVTTIIPTIHQNCASGGPGRCGITTFIP